jgi:hypothetical protein
MSGSHLRNMATMCTRALVAACAAWTLATAAAAAGVDIVPRLAPDARVLESLRALKENQAIVLGKARTVGEFNSVAKRFELDATGPRGRNYSIKMVWAPDRERALFAGANHAVPHRLNDVWEFDLAALAWVLLYAPDHPRSYAGLGEDPSDVRFEDGILVTTRGGPAIIGHTWWGITYDAVQRRVVYMNAWVTDVAKAIASVDGDPGRRYRGPPLWTFDPSARRWEPVRAGAPAPRQAFGGMLEYVDALHGSVWHANSSQSRGTWHFDAKTNRWSELSGSAGDAGFAAQSPQREQVAYYDPVRQIIVAHRHRETFHFDVKAPRWKKVRSEAPDSTAVPSGYDAYTPMYYDPASGHGVLVDFRTSEVWAYDPDRASWTRLAPTGDPMPRGARRLAYFDPARNVLVVIDDLLVWAYRYRAR